MVDNAHEVEVQCSAGQIPESITLDVADLGVGEQKTAAGKDSKVRSGDAVRHGDCT